MADLVSAEPISCERVLILDGDLEAVESLGPTLVSEGVSVVHGATTRAEAEGLLAQGFRPSAVVLDPLAEPERGEFARRLKADPALFGVPVIAVSGDRDALRQLGSVAERSLLKPARPLEVVAALRDVFLGRTCDAVW